LLCDARMWKSILLVAVVGCVDQPPPSASVRVTWGGANVARFSDNPNPITSAETNASPVVSCPDWGSIAGRVTAVVAHVVGSYSTDESYDCEPGGATFSVPVGQVSISFDEVQSAPGGSLSDPKWDRSVSLDESQTVDLGFLNLDELLIEPEGDGGGCEDEDGCGGGGLGTFL
jgi:hypothetical protein